MVRSAATEGLTPVSVEAYSRIQLFYANQSQLLDSGQAHEWAQTFTEDGAFSANGAPRPSVGRDAIETAARHTTAELAERRLVRRHWLGMVTATPLPDGIVHASCYALITETPRGGSTRVLMSTTCDDELVMTGGGILVRRRRVLRDDLDVT